MRTVRLRWCGQVGCIPIRCCSHISIQLHHLDFTLLREPNARLSNHLFCDICCQRCYGDSRIYLPGKTTHRHSCSQGQLFPLCIGLSDLNIAFPSSCIEELNLGLRLDRIFYGTNRCNYGLGTRRLTELHESYA